MKKLTTREIKEENNRALEELYKSTLQNDFNEYSKKIKKFLANTYWEQMANSYLKIGAFDKAKLVGFAIIAYKPFGGILFINWLSIAPTHRRQGVGKQLMKYIEKHACRIGIHSIHLETNARNLSFYQSVGYEQYGFDEKGYFGTDNYLLKKNIQKPTEANVLK